MSNFHLASKVLNYIDTRPKENEVKGAIKLDANLGIFIQNGTKGTEKVQKEMATNIYATLDKKEPLSTFIAQISDTLGLKEAPENYALMFEEKRRFVTEYNKHSVAQGFFLMLSASPSNFAKHFLAQLGQLSKSAWPHLPLFVSLCSDPAFVETFVDLGGVQQLAKVIEGFPDECHPFEPNSPPPLFSLMRSLLTVMRQFPVLCPWADFSPDFVQKMAIFVNGHSKFEQNDSRALALGTLLALVERCDHLHESIREQLTVESLIRHLDNSDERISLNSLSLINAIYELAGREERVPIIKTLHEGPFIAAIGRTLEKTRKMQPNSLATNGTTEQRELCHQLGRLQHIRFDEVRALSQRIPSDQEITYVLNEFVSFDAPQQSVGVWDDDRSEFCRLVMSTPPGSLAVCTILKITRPPSPPQDGAPRHNSSVTSAQLHQTCCANGRPFWWPMVLAKLVDILIKVLNICGSFSASASFVGPCHLPFWRLVLKNKGPFDTLFHVLVELFQRTWSEMHAKIDDLAKVLSVVHDQMERAMAEDEETAEQLEGELLRKKYSYFCMQKIWKREETAKEELELSSKQIQPLREHLRPQFERMVLQLRINFLKKGINFGRLIPNQLTMDNSNIRNSANSLQQQSWRLDDRQRHFHFWDCGKHSELALNTKKKLAVSKIRAVHRGTELTARLSQQFGPKEHKKAIQLLLRFGLCLELDSSPVSLSSSTEEDTDYFLCFAGEDESEFLQWLEGVECLLWPQKALQKHSIREEFDRLLSMEIQMRLMDVQQHSGVEEMPSLSVPNWPTDFSWIPTLNKK